MAADVYGVAPHTGRGGWTWYTGSAGWMYRLLLETLLGVNLEGNQLRLTPSLPKTWNTFTLHYRYRQTPYHIRVTRLAGSPTGGNRLTLDGQTLPGNVIPLVDDRRDHSVELQVS
jgi:cellobiose phosphorylase